MGKLSDILNGSGSDFNDRWNATAAAGEFGPVPRGVYVCHATKGELEFRRVCDGQNSAKTQLPLSVIFAHKQCNSTGLQLADLMARPVGRKTLQPDQPNRAYDILAEKFDHGPDGQTDGWGLKIFPA